MQTLSETQSSPTLASARDVAMDSPTRESGRRTRLMRLVFAVIVLALLLAVGTARAATPQGTGSVVYLSADGPREATRVATDVAMTVNGMIARVTVRQSFRNDSAEWVEARYTFPLPETAAVDRLHMWAGEREIVGQIQPREKARATFAKASREGRKASLVEQQRPNLFDTRVANLGPGETLVVQIEYQQRVDYDQGEFSLRFPMAVTPRFAPSHTGAPPDADLPRCVGEGCARASVRVALTPGFALDYVTSRYHPVDVVQVGEQHQVSLRGTDTLMDRDFELAWRPASGSEVQASLFMQEKNGRHYGMLMLVPPRERGGPARGRELVLVIDRSGSMGGTSIVQARRALRAALDGLSPADRFNVIAFDDHGEALFPAPRPADRGALRTAARFVDGLEAGGGTNIARALRMALNDHAAQRAAADGLLRQVVFITDGSVGNEESLFKIIHARLGDARLFTVGIGAAPNSYFMRRAARFGRGSFTHIGALDEVQSRMDGLLTKLANPALTDIDVDWSVALDEPARPFGDVYFGEPVLVTARFTAPPSALQVRGANGFYMSVQPVSSNAKGVSTLWARERIEQLMDERLTNEDRDALELQITKLALDHHLVSAFTSLVAVERTPARPVGAPLAQRSVAGVLPAGMAAAVSGYPMGATSWRLQLLIGALLMLAALGILRARWPA